MIHLSKSLVSNKDKDGRGSSLVISTRPNLLILKVDNNRREVGVLGITESRSPMSTNYILVTTGVPFLRHPEDILSLRTVVGS